jgi:hypothetical protein
LPANIAVFDITTNGQGHIILAGVVRMNLGSKVIYLRKIAP